MAERVTDLRDIERRVVAHLVGEPEPGVGVPEEPSVLVAEDLAPADTAGLDPQLVLALVTERGGPTSHTAIIARQLGIPCVVGRRRRDGARGRHPAARRRHHRHRRDSTPTPTRRAARVAADVEARAALALVDRSRRAPPTASRSRSSPTSPTASPPARRPPPRSRASGSSAPSCASSTAPRSRRVDEQAAIYGEVLDAFGDERYVVVRTLDAGSDKPVAFATHEGEENPALGVRGLRLSFGNPGLLDRQLDAIAAAARATGTETWVMAPMVATVAEAAGVRRPRCTAAASRPG